MTSARQNNGLFLDSILKLHFIKAARYMAPKAGGSSTDGQLRLATASGVFVYRIQRRMSYIGGTLLHTLITRPMSQSGALHPIILFTRYVPLPSAEKLIAAGINFVDQAGNIHLSIGDEHSWTVIGKREVRNAARSAFVTPAKIQLLFSLASLPNLEQATVRQLAEVSKVAKSNVAYIRKQLIDEGTLFRSGKGLQLVGGAQLLERLAQGYQNVLKPRLIINRFRAPDASLELFLKRSRQVLGQVGVQWSITGGWAAYRLQKFYKGQELTMFTENLGAAHLRQLRLLPDAKGQVLILRSIGAPCFWKKIDDVFIAHPTLLYAELLQSLDPRAHEAAESLKEEYWSDG